MKDYCDTYVACVECDTPPETGLEPDPNISRCPVCGSTSFELFVVYPDSVTELPELE
jgi:hypothetical protein